MFMDVMIGLSEGLMESANGTRHTRPPRRVSAVKLSRGFARLVPPRARLRVSARLIDST
jgi:hypothetical protein